MITLMLDDLCQETGVLLPLPVPLEICVLYFDILISLIPVFWHPVKLLYMRQLRMPQDRYLPPQISEEHIYP